MRLPVTTIKTAILHAEEECRLAAASFFSGAFSEDESVMPLVIQAVEIHGRDAAFRILRSADRMAQTPATVDWLLGELRRDYALDDPDDDNYRFAIALVIYRAQPALLVDRRAQIAALPMYPDPLRGPLDERLDMLAWDWDRGWAALEALGESTMHKGGLTWDEAFYADRLIESLARHRATKGASVLSLFGRQCEDGGTALIEWLRPLVINLVGTMRLESAVPLLVESLSDKNLNVADESTTALIKIDTDAAVRAIADKWGDAGTDFRAAASDVLEHVHTDLCAESCLKFFIAEEDAETKSSLAHAVLSQFVEEGIEPVRQFVLGRQQRPPPNHLDIRYRLVAACEIMGASFAELAEWHDDAVANRWGMGDYTPPRLAESFRADHPGPKKRQNGRDR